MKVKEIMSADTLKHCAPETSLATAASIMKENNHGALPVIDASEKVVGIITDRDICLKLGERPGKAVSDLSVREVIANAKLHTVLPDQPLSDALRVMRRYKIGRLPVIDKDGRLKGVLSINNLLKHAITHKTELGALASEEENLAKTINALFDRNNSEKKAPLEVADNE